MKNSILIVAAVVGFLAMVASISLAQGAGAGVGASGAADASASGVPGASGNTATGNGVPGASGNTATGNGVPGASGNTPTGTGVPGASGNVPPPNPPSQSNGTVGSAGSASRSQLAPGMSPTNSVPGVNIDAQGPAGRGVDVNVDPSRRGADIGINAGGNRVGIDTQRDGNRTNQQALRNNPNDWRFSYYNGEWWYWLPNNSWVFYRDNRWNPYQADEYRPFSRYTTGYRGTLNNNTNAAFYTDEYGRRYRRDYSPDRRTIRDPDAPRLGERVGNAIRGAVSGEPGARADVEIGGDRRDNNR